jgi:hypothetical protein
MRLSSLGFGIVGFALLVTAFIATEIAILGTH